MERYKVELDKHVGDWIIVKGDQVYDYGFATKAEAEAERDRMQMEADNQHLNRHVYQ